MKFTKRGALLAVHAHIWWGTQESHCSYMYMYSVRLQHRSALKKYESIWAKYESEYDSLEAVREMKNKKEELYSAKRER